MSLKNLQEVCDLFIPLAIAYEDAMADGEFQPIRDGMKFLSSLKYIPAAMKDANLIIDEMDNASDAEWDSFLQVNKKKFDLDDDNLEANIELALEVGVQVAKFLLSFKSKA